MILASLALVYYLRYFNDIVRNLEYSGNHMIHRGKKYWTEKGGNIFTAQFVYIQSHLKNVFIKDSQYYFLN